MAAFPGRPYRLQHYKLQKHPTMKQHLII